MGQNITLKIAGKEFPLSVNGPETERIMRLAAEDVNDLLAKYDVKMPNSPLEDRLALVALGEAVSKLQNALKLSVVTDEAKALKSDIAGYLEAVK